ncbi:hypothetical protein DFH11DRAFT_1880637 [Phellopilus nigrolimitatus]|nr:hypothetical protein DFH11DRAFT_1880637 [Phellopilus nigrolimitatus]
MRLVDDGAHADDRDRLLVDDGFLGDALDRQIDEGARREGAYVRALKHSRPRLTNVAGCGQVAAVAVVVGAAAAAEAKSSHLDKRFTYYDTRSAVERSTSRDEDKAKIDMTRTTAHRFLGLCRTASATCSRNNAPCTCRPKDEQSIAALDAETTVSTDTSANVTPLGSGTPTGTVTVPGRHRSGTAVARLALYAGAATPSASTSRPDTETEEDADDEMETSMTQD